MKFATFNANSIRARLAGIQEWLRKEAPDILCLQETKVQDKDFPKGELEDLGYHALFRGQKTYNGVAVLSRDTVKEARLCMYDTEGEEARFLTGHISGIPVINVYVPQGYAVGTERFQNKLRWLSDLLSFVKRNYASSSPLLLTGDFNVALEDKDVYDPEGLRGGVGFHAEEQALMHALLEWGFFDVFRKHHPEGDHYTFWDYRIPNAVKRRMGWRIDYIFATKSLAERCLASWIDIKPRLGEKPSDHTFLVAEFNLSS